jgi:hypothetical protein
MREKCRYRKKDDTPCWADAQSGKNLCVFHDPIQAEKVRRARQAGGRKNRAATMPANTPHSSLKNGADAVSLLGDTINRTRTGELDPRVANSIGYLCGILLRAFEVNNVEDRLAILETAVGNRPRTKSQLGVEDFEFIPEKSQ